MDNLIKAILLVYLVTGCVFGLICAWLAQEKNRDANKWFVIGLLLGFLGLLLIGFAPKSESQFSVNHEAQSIPARIGTTSLIFAVALWALPIYVGFSGCIPTAEMGCAGFEIQLSPFQAGLGLDFAFDFSPYSTFGPYWILDLKSIFSGILFVLAISTQIMRVFSNQKNPRVD